MKEVLTKTKESVLLLTALLINSVVVKLRTTFMILSRKQQCIKLLVLLNRCSTYLSEIAAINKMSG